MQELPVSLGRVALVSWSITWRYLLIIVALGLCWKLTMNRSTHGAETVVWYLITLGVYVVAVFWALRKASWSGFRVVLVKREQQ